MRIEERKKVVQVLIDADGKPLSTTKISEMTELPREKVYNQLTQLEESGVVSRKKDGRVFWTGKETLGQKHSRDYPDEEVESMDEEELK